MTTLGIWCILHMTSFCMYQEVITQDVLEFVTSNSEPGSIHYCIVPNNTLEYPDPPPHPPPDT